MRFSVTLKHVRNVLLAMPSDLAKQAKICASQRNTPVSSEPLGDVVGQVPDDATLCDREEAAMDAGLLHVGSATWSRDELHAR